MTNQNTANSTGGSARRRVDEFIARIERGNGRINAFIKPTPKEARAAADAVDGIAGQNVDPSPLQGMVVALKDNIDTAGIATTSGSNLFRDYIPATDAEVWCRLKDAGAVLIGKAGLHELAFGTTSQNVWFGAIRNPWRTDAIPGGSSGGSGAAVAAGFCDVALGTDTGGSVRIPAAMCGITGLRPTMGAVSNRGVRPVSALLDTVGPMARDVATVARAFEVMDGFDPADRTSRPRPKPLDLSNVDSGVKGLRVGLPGGFFDQKVDSEVYAAIAQAASVLGDLGAQITRVRLDGAELAAIACARIIAADAAAVYRSAMERSPQDFSEQTLRRLRTGFDVSGIDYGGYMREAMRWQRTVERALEEADVILTPTIRVPALPIADCGDLLAANAAIAPFTMAWALSGVPALALPCGFNADGLPLSCQLVAPPWQEALLFRTGWALQSATDFHQRPLPDAS